MAELDTLTLDRLADELLAFGQAPGRYAVHLGEPALVHKQMDTVVAWALGRTPDAWAERAHLLTDAAVLFVLRSCFAAQNNLYQVLGLRNRPFENGELKTRYRALIRLAHPDMNVKGLPANASALVNRAYEVLSDPDARGRYDAELASAGAGALVQVPAGYRPAPRYRTELQTEPGWAERLQALTARHPDLVRKGLVGFGVLTAAVLLIVTAASDNPDSRMLIAGSMPTTTSNRKAVVPEISQAVPVQQGAAKAPMRPATTTATPTPAATAQPKANLTLPAFERLPAPTPLGKPGVAAPVAVAVATATSPAPPPVATTKPDNSAAPPPATPANTAPALQAVPAPTVQTAAAPQTWPVDAVAAKQFLTSVLNAIENPGYMKQVHASLEASKVKGNLLMPALQRLKGPATIERMGWTETARPGLMLVQGYVELAPDGAERTDTPRLRFVVNAEFVGTKDGTAMSSLALKDDTPPALASPAVAVAPKPAPTPQPAAPAPMVATPKAATPPAGAAAPAPAPVAATKAATQPPTAAAPSPATAPAAATPAPAQAAADATAPVWPVDVAKSKAFLTSILNALESPHQTRQVVAYLAGLNVKGNLLRPVQQRVGDAKASVDRVTLTDTQKPGLLVLTGQVVLTPERAEGAPAPLRFAVTAEFVGTKDGTAMATLSVKEEP